MLKKNNIIGILIILIISASFVNGESINKSTNQLLNEINNNINYNNYESTILDWDGRDYTELVYGADEYDIFQGADIVVTSTLEDINDSSNPIPIPGENIFCIIKNSSGDIINDTSNSTNNDGIASVDLTNLNLSVGDYIINWYYNGSEKYMPAYPKEISTLKVEPTPPTPPTPTNHTLSLSSDNIILGESITLTDDLTNSSGNGIPNTNVTFNINGISYNNSTNDNGIATYIFTPDSVGEYNITAIFNGNEFYKDSTSMSKTLIVGDFPSNGNHLLNTGFPLILLLILIFVVGFYWRRK
jgi:hypothetical protein